MMTNYFGKTNQIIGKVVIIVDKIWGDLVMMPKFYLEINETWPFNEDLYYKYHTWKEIVTY